jgi:glycosyltransferase involved in cell wall biosynthesis
VRALIVTVVHTPADARIRQRQITALLERGWEVTFAAPWSGYRLAPDPEVIAVDLPRAHGRHRLAALVAAGRLLRRAAPTHDVVVLHDPELVLAALAVRPREVVVLDVHEDTAAALIDRPWLPSPLRGAARHAVGCLERVAERRYHLLLAEDAYAQRFARPHPVVPNVPPVPPVPAPLTEPPRAVDVGRISVRRGARELLEVGRRLRAAGIALDLVGSADADVVRAVRAADAAGDLRWHGFRPNAEALALVDGAVAGLSLLHDVPNYRVSAPTKVYEYLARGVPAVTTPLPLPARLVSAHDVGIVVPFGDAAATTAAVLAFAGDPGRRREVGRRAHELAKERFDWRVEGAAFVGHLQRWATSPERAP